LPDSIYVVWGRGNISS